MMRLAAVTMVYNEAALLPVWLRHYGAQVGLAQCYVVDHGSDDGSTRDLDGVTVVRLPRSAHDDERRAAFVSDLCSGLLVWFDAVVFSDVDELLVAEPAGYAGLAEYAAAMPGDVATTIGINLLHLAGEQPAIDLTAPIGPQRPYGWFSASMCKPLLIRRPVRWAPGFHSADAPVAFGGLFLFHLRYCDRALALAKLGRTRAMAWADLGAGAHQRVGDAAFVDMLERLEAMDRRDGVSFCPDEAPLAGWLDQVRASAAGREAERYRIDLQISCFELWRLPRRLQSCL